MQQSEKYKLQMRLMLKLTSADFAPLVAAILSASNTTKLLQMIVEVL